MAKKPKPKLTVQVGPFPYEVYVDEDLIAHASNDQRQLLFGIADHQHQRIVLDPDLALEQAQDTLLHEVLHCVTTHSGLAMEWGDSEEGYVRRLTPLLLMVIKDNPALIEWLTED